MAKRFPHLEDSHRAFISRQRVFFTASAAAGTHVNVSPRSAEAFRVLDQRTVAYLDLTGSGNETAAHVAGDGRLTIMFCAFDGPPSILRLYGRGEVLHRQSAAFAELLAREYGGKRPVGARQMLVLHVDLVQTSCGYGVPLFTYRAERPNLVRWAQNKGPDGIEAYWRETNALSMDGLPTGILGDREP